MRKTVYICSAPNCDYETSLYGNIKRHEINEHGITSGPSRREAAQIHTCLSCPSKFSTARALKQHTQRNHEGVQRASKITCEICEYSAATQQALTQHFQEKHDKTYELSVTSVENVDVFKQWLKLTENQSCSSFYLRRTSGQNKYYRCNYVNRGRDDGVSPSCTAFIQTTTHDTGELTVKYCDKHSHDFDPRLLNMEGSAVEDKIVSLLELGVENKTIINELQAPYLHEERPLCHDFYVTLEDVRRVKERFQLIPGRAHQEDVISLQMLLEQCNDDMVVYYQPAHAPPSANGFLLNFMTPLQKQWLMKYGARGVVLDDTHAVTTYTMRLTTMLVIDHHDRGLPVAFLLSAQVREADVRVLFESILSFFPEFHPEFLMSDDDSVFWNAFKAVFPHARTRKSLCKWHQLRTLLRNSVKLNDGKLKQELMDRLKLIFNLTDLDEFSHRISDLYSWLEVHEEHDFLAYFTKKHLSRQEEWAAWARIDAPFSTSMASETFHRRLKGEILSGKTNGRLDTLVHRLMEYPIKYRAHLAVQDVRYSTTTKRQAETKRRHKRAVEECPANIIKESQNTYKVPSSDLQSTQIYSVVQYRACPCDKELNMHCSQCAACPYSWKCGCPSSTMSGVCCKHVHMVHLKFAPDNNSLDITDGGPGLDHIEIAAFDDVEHAENLVEQNRNQENDKENAAPKENPNKQTTLAAEIKYAKEKLRNNLAGLRFDVLAYQGQAEQDLELLQNVNEEIEKLTQKFKNDMASSSRLALRDERDGPIREAAARFQHERLERRTEHNRTTAAKRKAQ